MAGKTKHNLDFYLEKIKQVHGDKYDYSLAKNSYQTCRSKIEIICPQHGIFVQQINLHANGQKCPQCANAQKCASWSYYLNKIEKIQGSRYDYSLSEASFKNSRSKIQIICPDHGLFEQSLNSHLRGALCPKCAKIPFKKPWEYYLSIAIQEHGNKYNYDLAQESFVNFNSKIKILCPMHGFFWQRVYDHIGGSECHMCCNIKLCKPWKYYLGKILETHGQQYDYSLVSENLVQGTRTKIPIICQQHGVFYQTIDRHSSGSGCAKCGFYKGFGIEQWIDRAKILHNDFYDYSRSSIGYINCRSKVEIICPLHGSFSQSFMIHANQQNSSGCRKCGTQRTANKRRHSWDDCLERFRAIHGNRYIYPENKNYENCRSRINIICPKHGEFLQEVISHSAGSGCPKCCYSAGESRIEMFLKNHNILFVSQKIFNNLRGVKGGILKFDFYLPKYNILIEYDGQQHFYPVEIFGGQEQFQLSQINDSIKNNFCVQEKIELIRISYLDNIEEILNQILFTNQCISPI